MVRPSRAVPLVLLAVVLGGCTSGAATAPTGGGPAVASPSADAEAGADAGNDRPVVTYDGLMVRRRLAIAVRATPGADVPAVRRSLDVAAAQMGMTLSDLLPDVLAAPDLERIAPDVVVSLPGDSTAASAAALVGRLSSGRGTVPGTERCEVVRVLVHDLRFTVAAGDPARVRRGIDREGILSDALGRYGTVLRPTALQITYTGPLLSDGLVQAVRSGIARRASTRAGAVEVAPRSTTGSGVEMSSEPAVPAVAEGVTRHQHELAAQPGAPTSGWVAPAFVTAVLSGCLLALALLWARRPRNRKGVRATPTSPEPDGQGIR
jgi:hypothetical protein